MPTPEAKKDFFISYTGADRQRTEWICSVLEEAGYSVVIIRPSDSGNFIANMHRALENSDRTLAVLSPAYFESSWCQDEWTAAHAKARQEGRDKLLCVRIADFQPPGLFAPISYIDLVGLDEAAAGERLLVGVRRGIKPLPSPPQGNPYPGLRAFKSEEADIFFGRDRETEKLVSRLKNDPDCRFLAVVGVSGIGRSSLVYAGLLPRLAAGAVEGSTQWRLVSFKPGSYGDNPFLALAADALRPLLPEDIVVEPIDLANKLKRDPVTIADFVDKALTNAPPSAQLCLFVDQFEELFTQAAQTYRERFVDLLTNAARHPRVRILVTLREDFLSSQALQYPRLTDLLQTDTGTFPLGPPGPAALTDMIRLPAQHTGLQLEDELVDKILKDAGSDAGALPLIAFCLNELYERAPKSRMTLKKYNEMGGLHEAIWRHAERLLKDWQGEDGANVEVTLETIFRGLVIVDINGKSFRRRAWLEDLDLDSASRNFIDKLIKGHLLICSKSSDGSGEYATVELAHDALLDKWPRLREWIERNRSDMVLWAELEKKVAEWLQTHDKDLLMKPRRLKEAKRLFEHPVIFGQSDEEELSNIKQYIKASAIRRWRINIYRSMAGFVVFTLFFTLVWFFDTRKTTMPVGSFDANQFGLYDVLGNVWEWTEDCLTVENPEKVSLARAGNPDRWCLVRGGSWDNHEEERVSANFLLPLARNHRGPTVGFRVVRELAPHDVDDLELQSCRAAGDKPAFEVAAEQEIKCFQEREDFPKMVMIPPASLEVREPFSELGTTEERAVAIGQDEVTVAQWNAYATDSVDDENCEKRYSHEDERRPVTYVSQDDAQCYVEWLSRITNQTYRLPSNIEWEYAARGGTEGCWWWGDEIGRGNANCTACNVTAEQFIDWLGLPVGSLRAKVVEPIRNSLVEPILAWFESPVESVGCPAKVNPFDD